MIGAGLGDLSEVISNLKDNDGKKHSSMRVDVSQSKQVEDLVTEICKVCLINVLLVTCKSCIGKNKWRLLLKILNNIILCCFFPKRYSRPPCVVVNCAGITRDALFVKMTEEEFDDVIAINLKVSFVCIM